MWLTLDVIEAETIDRYGRSEWRDFRDSVRVGTVVPLVFDGQAADHISGAPWYRSSRARFAIDGGASASAARNAGWRPYVSGDYEAVSTAIDAAIGNEWKAG